MNTIIEIAEEIHREIGSPNDIAKGLIQYFLIENIGKLNAYINTSLAINSADGSINPDIGEREKAILKQIYVVHFWEKKVRENLNSASVDPVLEVSENGATVRLINRNELAKTFLAVKQDEDQRLLDLIAGYKMGNTSPLSVDGADTVEGTFDPTFRNLRLVRSILS